MSEDLEMSEEMQALFDTFSAPARRVIGDGRKRETESKELTDPEEARYNAKMGLDAYGQPMRVDKVIAQREEGGGYAMNLAEGFDLLGDDNYGKNDTPTGPNWFFNPTGFNDW